MCLPPVGGILIYCLPTVVDYERFVWALLVIQILVALLAPRVVHMGRRGSVKNHAAWRAFERTNSTAILELRECVVAKICGKVRQRDTLLKSPITHRACVGHEVFVDVSVDNVWVPIAYKHECADFLVEDSTGVARVAAQDSELDLELDEHIEAGNTRKTKRRIRACLESLGKDSSRYLFLRCREGVLATGATVAVMGEVKSAPPRRGGGYRARQELPLLGSRGRGKLLIAADEARRGAPETQSRVD